MKTIFNIEVRNGIVNIGIKEGLKDIILPLLFAYLNDMGVNILEEIKKIDLSTPPQNASFSLSFNTVNEDIEVSAEGDRDSLTKLILSAILFIIKKDSQDVILDDEYSFKFMKFKKEVLNRYKDEVVYNYFEERSVDESGNYVIDIIINTNIHTFTVPAGAWKRIESGRKSKQNSFEGL